MAQLIYKPGQRRHLFAVRRLLPDPASEESYVAGTLAAVYTSTSSDGVVAEVRSGELVSPPFAVVHVTGYMLAMAHQGQEGFRVWVVEPGGQVQNSTSSRSWIRFARAGVFAKCSDVARNQRVSRVLTCPVLSSQYAAVPPSRRNASVSDWRYPFSSTPPVS